MEPNKKNLSCKNARMFSMVFYMTGLSVLSLACGLIINALRPDGVTLAYESPDVRIERVLADLGASPSVPDTLEIISLEQFREIVDQNLFLIIDARHEIFYELGHVTGAVSISKKNISAQYFKLKSSGKIEKALPLVVYCSDEECKDGEFVALALMRLGHSNVKLFRGGFDEWEKAGLPVEKGAQ